jgi:hypothetical protein
MTSKAGLGLVLAAIMLASGCMGSTPGAKEGGTERTSRGGGLIGLIDEKLLPRPEPLATWSVIERLDLKIEGDTPLEPRTANFSYYGPVVVHDEWGRNTSAVAYRFERYALVGARFVEALEPRLYYFEAATGRSLGSVSLYTGTRTHWVERGQGLLPPGYEAALFLPLLKGPAQGRAASVYGFDYVATAEKRDGCDGWRVSWMPVFNDGGELYVCPGQSGGFPLWVRSIRAGVSVEFKFPEGAFPPAVVSGEAQSVHPALATRAWIAVAVDIDQDVLAPAMNSAGGREEIEDFVKSLPTTRSWAQYAALHSSLYIGAASTLTNTRPPGSTVPVLGTPLLPARAAYLRVTDGPSEYQTPLYYLDDPVVGRIHYTYAAAFINENLGENRYPDRDKLPSGVVPAMSVVSAFAGLVPTPEFGVDWSVRPGVGPVGVGDVVWTFYGKCDGKGRNHAVAASAITGQLLTEMWVLRYLPGCS